MMYGFQEKLYLQYLDKVDVIETIVSKKLKELDLEQHQESVNNLVIAVLGISHEMLSTVLEEYHQSVVSKDDR